MTESERLIESLDESDEVFNYFLSRFGDMIDIGGDAHEDYVLTHYEKLGYKSEWESEEKAFEEWATTRWVPTGGFAWGEFFVTVPKMKMFRRVLKQWAERVFDRDSERLNDAVYLECGDITSKMLLSDLMSGERDENGIV